DELRDGFLMSESAAAICLETSRENSGADCAADETTPGSTRLVIERYAQGADGSHLTSSDPNGRVRRHLINKVTENRAVDLVHAHGTGTLTNDPLELAAIESVFTGASNIPCLYSHKGALGHSLGAAGLVSVVLNVLAHRHGQIPGNVRTARPLPTRAISIDRVARRFPIHRSLTLAAGFGGATAAVTLAST
ncbi:MAG: 3-oxoacyl-[ACP] synthase, partial [Phycisphaerales bacterium]|nr:3-oxoacyl-[ACP] synthase [Phycisphaerales bacterium]